MRIASCLYPRIINKMTWLVTFISDNSLNVINNLEIATWQALYLRFILTDVWLKKLKTLPITLTWSRSSLLLKNIDFLISSLVS